MSAPRTILSALIADASAPQGCDAGAFIESGLRAARGCKPDGRQRILTDIAAVLGCEVQALDFLFAHPLRAANDTDPVILPDYRARLHPMGGLAVAE